MSLLLHGPQCTYAFWSSITSYGGACKEASAPGQHEATAVCPHGFLRWDCYCLGFVAGAAYAKHACPNPYLPIWRRKDGHSARVVLSILRVYVQNDLAYLSHIVCAHYDGSFGCGSCLSAITSSVQKMKDHIKECSGLTPLPTASQESVPGGRLPKKSAPDSKHVSSKKKSSCSEKSQLAGQASQDSQASDRHVTRMTGASQRPRPSLPGAALNIRRKRLRRRSPASNLTRTPWHVTAFNVDILVFKTLVFV